MKKILLIDDEKDFCSVVKKRIEVISDYTVVTANSGREGLRAALRQKPDLILLDILMPDIDGIETLQRLKKDTKTIPIPVIMLTAKDSDEARIEAAGLYGDGYVVKPVEIDVLKSKIDSIFLSKKAGGQES